MSGKPVSLSKMMELVGAKWTCVFRATLMVEGGFSYGPIPSPFALPPPWGVGCVLGPYASNRNNNKYNIRSGSRPYIEFPLALAPSLLLWLIVFLASSECFKLYSPYLRHKVKATAKPTHILGTLSCQYENDELEFQFYLSPIFYAPILAIPSIHFDFLWLLVLGFRSTRSDGTRNAI